MPGNLKYLIGLNFLFYNMRIVTLDFADSEAYIMTRRDNRHELLEMLTPGHCIVIFNGQQGNVKEKAYILELGRYEPCLLCIS